MDMYKLVEKNKLAILNFLKTKNIVINKIDKILDKITVEIGQKKEYPYAKIDKTNPFNIIISEDIYTCFMPKIIEYNKKLNTC